MTTPSPFRISAPVLLFSLALVTSSLSGCVTPQLTVVGLVHTNDKPTDGIYVELRLTRTGPAFSTDFTQQGGIYALTTTNVDPRVNHAWISAQGDSAKSIVRVQLVREHAKATKAPAIRLRKSGCSGQVLKALKSASSARLNHCEPTAQPE